MAALSDRWRLLAPDFPGCGYSATPDHFPYTFDGYARFLERFVACLGVERFAIYLHDFGSQIGLRLAIRNPERIAACIIQNGDIYEDAFGPKYAALKAYWDDLSKEEIGFGGGLIHVRLPVRARSVRCWGGWFAGCPAGHG
ncbi:hypothetical protein CR159_10420 [Pollutimonas subterranea]|uniref:AB hydrolase-1 domain-containing protein n=1 Tax=Pollutimonas subterranea TaxID=2045210 RepID=A0A2N4U4T7_9BURK|nr:alpha/beta fold hydrolase [Pollutimonas subterranea]PLC50035.1 hypothetical protein CR159_10420 [Pollutimonas subterranea]